jgi:hypothetical protein
MRFICARFVKSAGLMMAGGLTLWLTGCGSTGSSDMASYDTPGSPKSKYIETGEVNRINPEEDRYTTEFVTDGHGRLYREYYDHGVTYHNRQVFREDRHGNIAPRGFMYDDHDRLVPVDRYLTESDRRINHKIRDTIEHRGYGADDRISLTTINGDVVVRGWVKDSSTRKEMENRIRDITGTDSVRFELAS